MAVKMKPQKNERIARTRLQLRPEQWQGRVAREKVIEEVVAVFDQPCRRFNGTSESEKQKSADRANYSILGVSMPRASARS